MIWHGDRICGIAIYDGEVAAYFPFRHETGPNTPGAVEDFRRLIRGKTIINHNIRFDMKRPCGWTDSRCRTGLRTRCWQRT